MIIIVGIDFLVWFLKRKKIQRKSNASSFELLNASSTLPSMRKEELDRSSINPVPKPPRTGVYGEAFSRMSLAMPREDSRQRLVWQDDLNSNYVSSPYMMFSRPEHSDTSSSLISWLDNRPGSRASIVTLSTMVSSLQSELPWLCDSAQEGEDCGTSGLSGTSHLG